MGPRLALLAALLLLTCAASSAQQPERPRPKCLEYGPEPSLRICTELNAKELGTGGSTVWTIRVEGGNRKSEIRLHNGSPAVIRLEGGDDQIVKADRHGEIRRKVTSISAVKAEAFLFATPYESSPERESAILSKILTSHLERAEARFLQERERLAATGYSVETVQRLLDVTESELLDLLSYPELAALRGYVQTKFREARIDLAKARGPANAAAIFAAPRAVPALWTGSSPRFVVQAAASPPGGTLQKEATDSILDRLLRGIHRLVEISRTNDFYTRICIVSSPEKAAFTMRPRISEAEERLKLDTNGELLAYRGLYMFSIRKGFKRIDCENLAREDCFLIDLVDDPKPIFYCDLNENSCERRPGPVPTGVCHGSGH